MNIVFRAMQLIVDNKQPTIDDFKEVIDKGNTSFQNNEFMYVVNQDLNCDNNYYWFYAEYENPYTYNDSVIDTVSGTTEKNPRPRQKVELTRQLFGLFCFETGLLYYSNLTKRNIFREYVEKALQKQVIIKNIYTSIDDFTNDISVLKEVCFTEYNNLFKGKESIMDRNTNIYGLDLPNKLYCKADYGNLLLGKELKSKLCNLVKKAESSTFGNLVVVGYDDNNIEQVFNLDGVLKTYELKFRDEEGMIDNEIVKRKLLEKVRNNV